ncbi:kinetochore Sim4 complex subunit Fta4 [Lineolata rhizophorae]|uniref:Kinetochore Sim4 complex subunit Fta4 n=1 Tax=Lineolata rhizophorae TaxID=578093 RepID=A0A6A6PE30_9PEZI|nr:kinetochore Sim4 complex subunit Fta4 [Lineolata rhizophorae]
MEPAGDTVIGLKTAFLRTQTRILSQPLQPSREWLRRHSNSEDGPSDAAVQDAMREVNRLLRRHTKAVYSTLAIRHVAEQINKLYWDAGAPQLYVHDPNNEGTDADEEDSEANARDDDDNEDMDDYPSASSRHKGDSLLLGGKHDVDMDDNLVQDAPLRIDDDLTLDRNILCLSSFPEVPSNTNLPSELAHLSTTRAALNRRLAVLRSLQSLLAPLRDPSASVQPHLATRDGALANELVRLRRLCGRVAGRVGEVGTVAQEEVEGSGDERMIVDERKKVEDLLV